MNRFIVDTLKRTSPTEAKQGCVYSVKAINKSHAGMMLTGRLKEGEFIAQVYTAGSEPAHLKALIDGAPVEVKS